MSFDDDMADCNDAFFESFADAETVVIACPQIQMAPTTRQAIVDRNPPTRDQANEAAKQDDVLVSLYNDAENGVTEIVVNRTTITLRPMLGGPVKELTVRRIEPQSDRAMWILRVR